MSREGRVFLFAWMFAVLISGGSTLPLWFNFGDKWGFLLLFWITVAIVAFPLGAMGIGDNMHDPRVVVMAFVDVFFYGWLLNLLTTRRLRRAS